MNKKTKRILALLVYLFLIFLPVLYDRHCLALPNTRQPRQRRPCRAVGIYFIRQLLRILRI